MTSILVRDTRRDTDTHRRGGGNVTTEAEIGVMAPGAGRAQEWFPREASKVLWPH